MNEYWIVKEKQSGKTIAHCGNILDAHMMLQLDVDNRVCLRAKFLQDQIIDVSSETDKQLPGQIGLPSGKINELNSFKEKLPQGEGKPIII